MTRMNLNTFARKGVFQSAGLPELIAKRLRDPHAIRKAGVFPYQIMTTWTACVGEVPLIVKNALQKAMEIAIAEIPVVKGQLYICPDVSGSMRSPVTGQRGGATTVVRCIDVAALISSAFVRKNSLAEVIPFEERVVRVELNPHDSIMTNAHRLAAIGGGGTNCSAPLALLNERRARGDLVILISDNQSWIDWTAVGAPTALMREWELFKRRNPKARMVCLDIQPYGNSQAKERKDILNIGGFSDAVFETIRSFSEGDLLGKSWYQVIEGNQIPG